jgi:hypothetical protein
VETVPVDNPWQGAEGKGLVGDTSAFSLLAVPSEYPVRAAM